MAGLLDIFGGGGSAADDPYADILTPAQRNQMQVQGLLAMAGAFAQAGMPSRLPVPFGSALGSAAAALGTGSEAGMTAAIANAYKAQQVRDLRAKAALQGKLSPIFQDVLERIRSGQGTAGVGVAPVPSAAPGLLGTGASPGAASPAVPAAAGGPLMMDRSLLYPDAAGGLLGPGDDTGLVGPAGKGVGLLSPAPAASVARMPTPLAIAAPAASPRAASSQDAAAAEVARLDAEYAAENPTASPAAKASMHVENIIKVNPPERGGSSTAPAEPDPGAGGDTPWGPTFAQAASFGAPSRGDPRGVAPLIRQAFLREGHDPEVALKVAAREGLGTFLGDKGKSGSAFQLYTGGGLGNEFQRQTGLDPLDPANEPAAIDWVAKNVNRTGWSPYHGAARAGIGDRTGLNVGTAGGGGGGEDAGWGPTFAEGGPDRVIPSGAGGNPPAATLAQYAAPGGAGVPGMPQLAPPRSLPGLAAPSTLPPLVPPGGAAPALGAGGKIPGLNMTPQELAVIDAMAESAGLGNPFKGLLDTYFKSPGYLQESAGATARGRIAEEEPSQLRVQAAKARLDMIQQMAKDGLTLDKDNNPVEIPGMRDMLGRTAGEVERAKQQATSQFALTDARVIGPDGQPTTTKMPIYEYIFRQQQSARNASMGAKPQPGDIVSSPISGPPPEGFEYRMDPNGRLTAEPIANTPAAQALQDRNRKQAIADQATQVARDVVVQNAGRVEDLVQNSTLPVTGTAGPFMSRIAGTAANDARVLLDTIKSRSTLDTLNQLRAASPTGGALGSVSDQEDRLLASAISSLDQSQTKDQFLFNLRRVKQYYIDAVHGPGTYSKLSDEPVLKVPAAGGIDKATYDSLPSGSPFTAPDGSRRIKP